MLAVAVAVAEDKGLMRGRQDKALEIAKNLLAAGIDLEVIKEITQLSDEALARLQ